jgi:hypothetical protein
MGLPARYLYVAGFLLALVASAQSQALNGQIEGVVRDQMGAGIAHAGVSLTNIETGAARSSKSNESGILSFSASSARDVPHSC